MLRAVIFFAVAVMGLSVLAQSQGSSSPHVDLIVIDGSINPAVDDFIRESIARAKSNGARALVIQLDTPGGLLSSTRTIVKEILGAPVPVIVYVAPSGAGAGSAGLRLGVDQTRPGAHRFDPTQHVPVPVSGAATAVALTALRSVR